jgi:UrcA family protein
MTMKTPIARNSFKTALALIALSTLGAGAARADAPAQSGSETRTKQVSFAGLDLSTPEGVSAATERVHQMARTMCSQLSNMDDLSKQPNFVKCVENTMTAAQPKVQELARIARTKSALAKN